MLNWTHFKIVVLAIFANILSYIDGTTTADFQLMIKNQRDHFLNKLTLFEKDEMQQKWYLIFKSNVNLEVNFMKQLFDMDDELIHLINMFDGLRDNETLTEDENIILDDIYYELKALQKYAQRVVGSLFPRFSDIENQLWKRLADKIPEDKQHIDKRRLGLLPYQIKHFIQQCLKLPKESEMVQLKEKFIPITQSWNTIKNELAKLATLQADAEHLSTSEIERNIFIYYNEIDSKLMRNTQNYLHGIQMLCKQHCTEWAALTVMLNEFLDVDLDPYEFVADNLYEKLLISLREEHGKLSNPPEFLGCWEKILEIGQACVSQALSVKAALIDKKEKIPNKTLPMQKLVIFTFDAFISIIEPIASYSNMFYVSGKRHLLFINSNDRTSTQIDEINKEFRRLKVTTQQQFNYIIKTLESFKVTVDKTPINRDDLDKLFADKYGRLNSILKLNAKLFEKLSNTINNLLVIKRPATDSPDFGAYQKRSKHN